MNVKFYKFNKEDFIKNEDWEESAVFRLENGFYVNGSIRCNSGKIEVNYLEPYPREVHGSEIEYYSLKR